MARFFNTAGVCEPRDHYMLPPHRRLPSLGSLIAKKAYFVVYAPRQSGKTTCFHHLARELTAAGRYAAQLASCETARTVSGDVDRAVNVVVRAIEIEAGGDLPEELRPPPAESVHHADAEIRRMDRVGASRSPGFELQRESPNRTVRPLPGSRAIEPLSQAPRPGGRNTHPLRPVAERTAVCRPRHPRDQEGRWP